MGVVFLPHLPLKEKEPVDLGRSQAAPHVPLGTVPE